MAKAEILTQAVMTEKKKQERTYQEDKARHERTVFRLAEMREKNGRAVPENTFMSTKDAVRIERQRRWFRRFPRKDVQNL